jgi:hypothetical protein
VAKKVNLVGPLKPAAIWALFTCGPVLVLIPWNRKKPDWPDVPLLLEFLVALLLIAVIGSRLLGFLVAGSSSIRFAILCGLFLGLVLPIATGYLWVTVSPPGFEASVGVFWGGVMMSLPSAIGGALSGWIQSRSKFRDLLQKQRAT